MSYLTGCIKRIKELSEDEINHLLTILSTYFDGITRDNFHHDLFEKEYIILLFTVEDETETMYKHYTDIQGFSTIKVLHMKYQDTDYGVVFSGDTIIDKAYWGTPELPKWWTRIAFALKQTYPDKTWYWFLISSGYRTYRYLPIFFLDYYPRYDQETPPNIQNLMDHLAESRYGDSYIKEEGIIRFKHSSERVKQGISDISDKKLKNKHIRFFVEKNPHFTNGDELVCLTEIAEHNFTPSRLHWTKEYYEDLREMIWKEE